MHTFEQYTGTQSLPRIYRTMVRPLVIPPPADVTPSELRIYRWRSYFGFRHTTCESVLETCIGKPVTNIHDHRHFMENPWDVPIELRGFIVYSPGTLYGGDKGAIYCPCWYFVDSEIRADLALIAGERTPVVWEEEYAIGLMPGRTPLRKVW